MTYPPRKVNGFMISGFETPSIDKDFTYPQGAQGRDPSQVALLQLPLRLAAQDVRR